MGAPKATDTPAAAAADNTCTENSRQQSHGCKRGQKQPPIPLRLSAALEQDAGSSRLFPCPCQAYAKWQPTPELTSRRLASFFRYLVKRWQRMLPQQQAT